MLSSSDNLTIRALYAVVNAAVVFFVLIGVFIGVNWHQMPLGFEDFLAMRVTVKNVLITAVCLTGGAAAFHGFGLTKPPLKVPVRQELIQVTKACTLAAVCAILFPLTSHTGAFSVRIAVYFLPTAILACVCGRLVSRMFMQRLERALLARRDVIIVGSGPSAANAYARIRRSNRQDFRVLGFVDSPDNHEVKDEIRRQIIGRLDELEAILMRQAVDEVLIALPAESCHPQIQSAIRTCERVGVEAKYFFSDLFELSLAKPTFEPDENTPVVALKVVRDDARLLVKRVLDIAVSIIGLAVLSPLMIAVAVAIRLTSPGSALFVQERYGFRKRRFRMYKFRTMVRDAEKLQTTLEARNEIRGPVFKLRDDPRVTPLGRLLRKTSLDELPQFFNVLRGEMSLVGPRPLPERDVSRFDDASLMRRFSVKPGITGLWQVSGRSNVSFERWIELDLRYIDTWSLSLDLEILARTIPSVLAGRGAT